MKPVIRVNDVSKVFGSGDSTVCVLKGITLELAPQRLVALRGRSGSGKTTLMNMLGALDYPTEGEIFIHEHEITALQEKARNEIRRKEIGFVFQSMALFPLMTAEENVEFGLRAAGIPSEEWQARTVEALEWVGLRKRSKHRPSEMSGGEQQRCAIARALAHKPSIILADEPSSALDSKNALQVMAVFREITRQQGMTILMTTHDPAIMEIADEVIGLEDGCIVQA